MNQLQPDTYIVEERVKMLAVKRTIGEKISMKWVLIVAAVGVLMASTALAAANVKVVPKDASGKSIDGKVVLTLKSDASTKYECETKAGACEISVATGGRYSLHFTSGDKQVKKSVMIPPNGTVTLGVTVK